MKREEKNLISRQKIMDGALKEFSDKGYALSSVNTICTEGSISKGIMYHYFKDKDEMYLSCLLKCFEEMTSYLRESITEQKGSIKEDMQEYFEARQRFFSENPIYGRIFYDAVVTPPPKLATAIKSIRAEFDSFSVQVLTGILEQVKLRKDVSIDEVVDTFRQYQDFINAKYHMVGQDEIDLHAREKSCGRAVELLLYGVLAREEE